VVSPPPDFCINETCAATYKLRAGFVVWCSADSAYTRVDSDQGKACSQGPAQPIYYP
jgi:hypothetical protein